jgi:hypothetical protein
MDKVEQIQKEIRGYLFSGTEISDVLKKKLSNQIGEPSIEIHIIKAQKDIKPAELSAKNMLPQATLKTWNENIAKIEKGLSANDSAYKISEAFTRLRNRKNTDETQILADINHLKVRANAQKMHNN